MMPAFLHGFILAFGLILPLGPQNAFVLSQGVSQPSLWRTLPVVMTAGLCDSLLILLAVLGVSAVVSEVSWLRWLLVLGGVGFLTVVGWFTWKAVPPSPQAGAERASVRRQMSFAIAISLGNPHAVVDTIGVIGTSSLAYSGADKVAFAAACVGVSWLWFLGLAVAGRGLSKLDTARRLLNPVSAVVMWVSAAYLLATLI